MECPEEHALLALLRGELFGAALAGIDSHLDTCESCRDTIATLASSREGVEGPKRELARGDAVGRFLVLEPLGRGAMGVVYAAYDPELDRRIALKLVHADADGPRARARLVREAQALAKLSHPHVVTVYDVGTRGDEVYLALELVEGRSLREWLAEPRSVDAVLDVIRQAGEGLAAAHDAGLVHRDVKPENVLVDRAGRVKVTDFGLARGELEPLAGASDEARDEGDALGLTRTGALLGTPAYMAPEQLRGENADSSSDQFALSVVAFEALTGARPFRGSSLAELRASIEAGPSMPTGVPRHVASALRRALAADPSARFPDVRALLAALAPRRSIARSVLPYALVGALAAGAWIAWRTEAPVCAASAQGLAEVWNDAARARLRAAFDRSESTARAGDHALRQIEGWARAWTNARVDACEDTHVRHEQSSELLDRRMQCLDRQRGALEVLIERYSGPDERALWSAIDAVETLPEVAQCDDPSSVAPPDLRIVERVATVRRGLDEARLALAVADHEDALERTAALLEAAEALGHAPLLAEAGIARAEALRAAARYREAEEASEVALFAAEPARDDRSAALAWLALARTAGAAGRPADAARYARHLEAAVARVGQPLDLRQDLLLVRGLARMELGQLRESEGDLNACRELAQFRFGARDPRLAPIETSLGNVARLAGRLEDALVHHERALALDREALGDSHPRVGRDLHNVAGVLRRMDRLGEARARYEDAARILRAALGAHPEVARTENSLGLLAVDEGDRGRARAHYEAALAIYEAHDHPDAAMVRYNLALLALAEGDAPSARALLEEALRVDEERLGPRAKRVAAEHVALGRALVALGELDAGRAELVRGRAQAEALGEREIREEAERALAAMDAAIEARPVVRQEARAPARTESPPAAVVERPVVVEEPVRPAPPIEETPREVAPPRQRPPTSGYQAGQPWE
jgi:tetratricopeptide (TPR) repeat protein/tRNA A-37 threonylcarbamoyl transferase component Bud32